MNKMEARYAILRKKMAQMDIDAIYVNSPENHLYMSDFDNPDGWIVITQEMSYLFADPRYNEAAKAEASPLCTVCLPGKPTLEEIAAECGIRSIGYEDRKMTCAALEVLKGELGDGVTVLPLGSLFTDIRAIKTEDEIAFVVAAQRIAEGAFGHICSVLKYDMTEVEVAAELEYYMKKNGSEKPSFDTICVSGTASSRPHGVPRSVKLEHGFLTMDYGATVNGYHSDMTRTVVVGKADAEMKRLYNTVLEAQNSAICAVREGICNAEVDKIARDIINSAGYEGRFNHGLGHGVGLEIHEQPVLNQKASGESLIAGQIVTVEPGIYIEGKYGCRIEDMVLVTHQGGRNLTDCPNELIEL